MRLITSLLALLAGLAAAPAIALAEHARPVPDGLTATEGTADFVIHYNPSDTPRWTEMTIQQYARAGAADFQESYSRLVVGGGGTPNAGLRAPVADSDGKTDVYIAKPAGQENFGGGAVFVDSGHSPRTAYVFMTTDLGRLGFRFRSAHEFMHVIQNAYAFDPFSESFANWAAGFALPDVRPGDNNFGNRGMPPPWLPLDCSYGEWKGTRCGDGYPQWTFVQHLVETYGPAFVVDYYERFKADTSQSVVGRFEAQLADFSGGGETLSTRYADYARDVWDPTRWRTRALAKIHDDMGAPSAFRVDRPASAGSQRVAVDHLATRYVHVRNDSGFKPSGPADQLRITVNRPGGLSDDGNYLARNAGEERWTNRGWSGRSQVTLRADPAVLKELVLPLSNDTIATDGLSFGYRVELLPGTPTPPANDMRAGAVAVALNEQAETESVYAGGRGADEAPDGGCGPLERFDNATRGVWYRFTTPNWGAYTYDVTASDFPALVALYDSDSGAFAGCSAARGRFEAHQSRGQTWDALVARQAGSFVGGSKARLLVTGPAADATAAPPSGGDSPDVIPVSNQFAFGKLKRNAKKGTARLAIRVPGSGRVVLAKTKQLERSAARARSAGLARLQVRPRGKVKRKLARALRLKSTVRLRVRARVTYRPIGGQPRTKTQRIRLVRRG